MKQEIVYLCIGIQVLYLMGRLKDLGTLSIGLPPVSSTGLTASRFH